MEIQSSYAAAMSKVAPGTFVPDIAPQKPVSQPLDAGDSPDGTAATTFKATLAHLFNDVNDKMTTAGKDSVDLATGVSNDFEGTVKANEEASLAFQMTESIRSKIMEAYSEIQQMQF
jgi:flagellar hook-basal body complex protein FliE